MKKKIFTILFFLFIGLGAIGQGPPGGGGPCPDGSYPPCNDKGCWPPPCIPTMAEWAKMLSPVSAIFVGVYFLRRFC